MDGRELTLLRRRLGLTQRAMSAKMGLGLRAYSSIEATAEEINPRHQMLAERVALAEAVSQRDYRLAPRSVREEALALATLIEDANSD